MTPFALDPISPQTVLPATPHGIDDQQRLARKSPMQIAREFEAILVAQMIGAMRKTVSSIGGLFSNNGPNKILDGAFDQQVAQSITKHAHLGIAERLAAQMERHAHGSAAQAPAAGAALPAAEEPLAARPLGTAAAEAGKVSADHDAAVASEAVAQIIGGDEGRVTSGFGLRHDPITGRTAFHGGIDVAAPRGSAIHAVAGGEVVFSGRRGRAGNVVDVREGDVISTYAHVQRALVRAGQKVAAGDVLATVGSTGRSTGPHVHFAVTREGQTIDPAALLDPGESPAPGQQIATAEAEEG
ncbi:MAG TPA: peptidoglycan DD-metalloendopeptidase family protein [Candidatus Binatia bacterium]|jgi:murein DD-endopeptidase MepM/ murein hydrolase activator NlpD